MVVLVVVVVVAAGVVVVEGRVTVEVVEAAAGQGMAVGAAAPEGAAAEISERLD